MKAASQLASPRREVTELVSVGQMRDIEFIAVPGDWPLHCHMAHHTMNAMGHVVPNPTGIDRTGVEARVRNMLPGSIHGARGDGRAPGAHLRRPQGAGQHHADDDGPWPVRKHREGRHVHPGKSAR